MVKGARGARGRRRSDRVDGLDAMGAAVGAALLTMGVLRTGVVSVAVVTVLKSEEEVEEVEGDLGLDVELMATQDPGSGLAWCNCQLDAILKARHPSRPLEAAEPPKMRWRVGCGYGGLRGTLV